MKLERARIEADMRRRFVDSTGALCNLFDAIEVLRIVRGER